MSAQPPMLGARIAAGGMLLVGARLISRVIDLVTMLVLGRLLMPSDFGVVAIAVGVVSVLDAAFELPITQALVRLPAITKAQYDTAFTLSLLRGAVMTVILLLGAAPIAHAYHDPRLTPLVCVFGLMPALRCLVSPRLAEYQRHMSFWRDFSIELGGRLVGFGCAVGLALATGSYWSIVSGTMAFNLTVTVASYALAPYRPCLSLAELPIFTSFIGWLSAGQLINALNWQFERLLLGKLRTASQLGLFTTASDLANIPFLALFSPISRPLLAAFSHLREERSRVARSYQNASIAIVAIGLPFMVGECLLAEPAVRFILGERWMGAVPLVQALSLSLIPALFTVPAYPLFMAFGKTKLLMYRNVLEFGVKFPIAVVGVIRFGFPGLIAARLLSEVAVDTFSVFAVRRLLGLSVAEQVLAPWRSIVGTLVMAPVVFAWVRCFDTAAGLGGAALVLASTGLVGAATYGATSWALWRATGRPSGPEAMVATAMLGVVARVAALRRPKAGYPAPPPTVAEALSGTRDG